MHWREEGLLLAVRPHGETSAIIQVLTRGHGRHAGLVKGGRTPRLRAVLQPGAQLLVDWRARLTEHLGHCRVELVTARAAALMEARAALAAFNAVGALLVAFLPERQPEPAIYDETVALADALAAAAPDWPARYARWELALLGALGYGLDLGACAVTGAAEGLGYVSPRSGRAVSVEAAAPWAGRLLPLPAFLLGGAEAGPGDVEAALRLTGHFLATRACPAVEREALPPARERLVQLLARHGAARAGTG